VPSQNLIFPHPEGNNETPGEKDAGFCSTQRGIQSDQASKTNAGINNHGRKVYIEWPGNSAIGKPETSGGGSNYWERKSRGARMKGGVEPAGFPLNQGSLSRLKREGPQ